MEQQCPGCQVLIDRPARFCRQCGTPLTAESATARPQPAVTEPREYQPGMYLLGNETRVADTGRLYTPPSQPAPPTAPRRRIPVLRIAIVFLLLIAAVGVGAGVLIYSLVTTRQPSLAIVEQLKTDTRGQILDEIARAREELKRARAEAAQALPDAEIPAPEPEALAALTNFRYPQSTLRQSVSVLGNDVLRTSTTDKFAQVREHYQKLIGPPILENFENGNEEAVFKSAGPSPVVVTITRESGRADEISIVILRSKLLRDLPAPEDPANAAEQPNN